MKKFYFVFVLLAFLSPRISAQTSQTDSTLVVDISNAPLNQDNAAVSISRKNKNVIVVGAASDFDDMDTHGMLVYASTDRGRSWAMSRLPLPVNPDLYIYGEPSIAADNNGDFYYAYITNDGVDSGGRVSVAFSADGTTWKNVTPPDNSITTSGHPDGVFIVADNSTASSHNGRVYAVWNQYYSDPLMFLEEGVMIAWSDDQGKRWSTPKFLGVSDDYQTCKTGKHGEVYVTCTDSLGIGHELFVSADGGSTFTTPLLPFTFNSYPQFAFGPDSGYTGLKGSQGFAAFPYFTLDVDLSSGRIHAIYGDFQGGAAILQYVYSENNGQDWSTPQFIGSLDGFDRFDPWVSVDQKTGVAYALYYSSEADPGNILTAPYRIRLSNTLSDQPEMINAAFNPLVVEKTDSTAPYIGDHTTSDAFDSVYAATWTQNREGAGDADVFVFVNFPKQGTSAVGMPVTLHSSHASLYIPYPNPSRSKTISLNYYLPDHCDVTFDLVDLSGILVRHLAGFPSQAGAHSRLFELDGIPSGCYLIRMTSLHDVLTQKFVLVAP
ncbi:MAG: T9SS type A sorting domain-containing protein [Bacteroidota bacterium]|nr:T9SS type A sorting domain-containing protein [Bacteroidota bacterium]